MDELRRLSGREFQFQRATEKARRHYNVQTVTWERVGNERLTERRDATSETGRYRGLPPCSSVLDIMTMSSYLTRSVYTARCSYAERARYYHGKSSVCPYA